MQIGFLGHGHDHGVGDDLRYAAGNRLWLQTTLLVRLAEAHLLNLDRSHGVARANHAGW